MSDPRIERIRQELGEEGFYSNRAYTTYEEKLLSLCGSIAEERDRWRDVVAARECPAPVKVCTPCGGVNFIMVAVAPTHWTTQCRDCDARDWHYKSCGNCPQDIARAERDAAGKEKPA